VNFVGFCAFHSKIPLLVTEVYCIHFVSMFDPVTLYAVTSTQASLRRLTIWSKNYFRL